MRSRPDGSFPGQHIPRWLGGVAAWVDVAITSPRANSAMAQSPWKPGHAAVEMEKRKRRKYEELVEDAGAEFVPFVMEDHGGFGPAAVGFLKVLAYSYADQHNLTLPQALERMSQRLAVAQQRANAHSIMCRAGDAKVIV